MIGTGGQLTAEYTLKHTLNIIFLKRTYSQSFDNFIHTFHQTFNYIDSFKTAISYEEFLRLCIDRFRRHLDTIKSINRDTFQFYYRCIESIDDQSKVTISPLANELFLKRIKSNPIIYLKQVIVERMTPHDGHTYSFEGFVSQVFSGWEKFKSFLDELDQDDEIVSIVIEFYNRIEQHKFVDVYVKGDLLERIKKLKSI